MTEPPVVAPAAKREILWRGLSKRCPRCGVGPLYEGWSRLRDCCPDCRLRYVESPGDPWFFLMLVDRAAFLFPIIVALFFGLHRTNVALFVALCVLAVLVLIVTTPSRYGLCVGINYLTRVRWGDQSDPTGRPVP